MKSAFFLIVVGISLFAESQTRPSFIPYRKGELWGYCDTNKNLLIPVQYEMAFPFVNCKALVGTTDDRTLQIDTSGKTVVKLDIIVYNYEGYGLVSMRDAKTRSAGLLNLDGTVAIEPKYENITVHHGDSIEVWLEETKGVINRKGETIVEFEQYEEEFLIMELPSFCEEKPCYWPPFSEGLALAGFKGKYGYCNEAGNLVVQCKYEMAELFMYGLGKVVVEAGGQTIKPSTTDENGVILSHAVYLADGYVDRLGTEYWED